MFLWVDGLPEPRRTQVYKELRDGTVLIERLKTLDGGKEIDVPDGMIHHWVGMGFVPGVLPEEAARFTLDYDRHQITYAPDVIGSKLLSQEGDTYRAQLRFRKKKVIIVVLDTEHEAHFTQLDAARAHTWSHSTRIQESTDAGGLKPVGRTEASCGGCTLTGALQKRTAAPTFSANPLLFRAASRRFSPG